MTSVQLTYPKGVYRKRRNLLQHNRNPVIGLWFSVCSQTFGGKRELKWDIADTEKNVPDSCTKIGHIFLEIRTVHNLRRSRTYIDEKCSSAVESFTVGGIPIVNIFLSNELSGFSQRHTYPKIGCGTNTYIPGTFLALTNPTRKRDNSQKDTKRGIYKEWPNLLFYLLDSWPVSRSRVVVRRGYIVVLSALLPASW